MPFAKDRLKAPQTVAPNSVKAGRSGFTFRQLGLSVWAHRTSIAMLVGATLAVTWLAERRDPHAESEALARPADRGLTPVGPLGEDSARRMDLDRRLFEARAQRQQAELRLNGEGRDGGSRSGAQTIQSLQVQLAEKQAALMKLEPVLGDHDPQYRSFEAEIAQTRAHLYQVIVAYQKGLRDDVDAARAIEQKLEREREMLRGESRTAQQASAVPPSPVNAASRKSNLVPALGLSLLAGVLLALLREVFDRRIRCIEDFERNLGVPVLTELSARGGP